MAPALSPSCQGIAKIFVRPEQLDRVAASPDLAGQHSDLIATQPGAEDRSHLTEIRRHETQSCLHRIASNLKRICNAREVFFAVAIGPECLSQCLNPRA